MRLCQATYAALRAGIAAVRPGQKVSAIGEAVEAVAMQYGCHVVREFTGHFIGRELHMSPHVHHVANNNDTELRPGMTFTIEPILTEPGGSAAIHDVFGDGWAYATRDRSWTAQYEHTVLVAEPTDENPSGVEVLTASSKLDLLLPGMVNVSGQIKH